MEEGDHALDKHNMDSPAPGARTRTYRSNEPSLAAPLTGNSDYDALLTEGWLVAAKALALHTGLPRTSAAVQANNPHSGHLEDCCVLN